MRARRRRRAPRPRARRARALRRARRAHRLRPRTSARSALRSPSRNSGPARAARRRSTRAPCGCSRRRPARSKDWRTAPRSPPRPRARGATRPRARSPPVQSSEAALEVGDEVFRILEPDLQPDQGTARPGTDAARLLDVLRHDQALEASPAVAQREHLEPVDERGEAILAAIGELHAEEAGRAEVVALPERVAGVALERRIEH